MMFSLNPIYKLYEQLESDSTKVVFGPTEKKRKRDAREGQSQEKEDEISKEMAEVITFMGKFKKKPKNSKS